MDKLDIIFNKQTELNNTVTSWAHPEVIKTMTEDEKYKYASKVLDVLIVEASEAKLATGCRWWKYEKDTSGGLDHLIEEGIDILHFITTFFLILGLSAEDVYQRYIEKNKTNLVRPDWVREVDNG